MLISNKWKSMEMEMEENISATTSVHLCNPPSKDSNDRKQNFENFIINKCSLGSREVSQKFGPDQFSRLD